MEFILRAFSNGQDGVFIGGCRLGECNYITHGNFDALSTVYICRKIMAAVGLHPERLRIEFMSGADGNLLAGGIDDFVEAVKALGPIGRGEGEDGKALTRKLDAARKLIPYIKLVERERLRIPLKSEGAYRQFFTGDAFSKLFDALIADQLAISQITSLLRKRPLSTGEISEALGLDPSEVSNYMNRSSRQGFVKYDAAGKCYMLAVEGM